MFLLGIIIWGGLILYILLARYSYKTLKEKLAPNKKFIAKIVLALFILLPVYDIVITNVLAGYYCLTAPSTYINKKIEYPMNIYWEDNVYPGFSKEDRKLMIINYLDGVHLKTMALNGAENKKVYVYHLDKPIWKEFKKRYERYIKQHPPKKDRFKGHSFDIYEAYAKEIMKTEQIFTKQTMPKTNYTVTFNEVKLNPFARHFFYSDETKVIENNTSKVIAYNRRYMRFYYNIFPDVALGGRYYATAMCGESYYGFERYVFTYRPDNDLRDSDKHDTTLNNMLYNKYIKGEK